MNNKLSCISWLENICVHPCYLWFQPFQCLLCIPWLKTEDNLNG